MERGHSQRPRGEFRGKILIVGATAAGLNDVHATPLSGQVKTLYSRGLDQSDEYAADQLGAQLAARAGYDPHGLAAVLQTLRGLDPSAGALALLYRTHPRPADRLDALLKLSDRLDAYGTQATVSERFNAQLAAFKNP